MDQSEQGKPTDDDRVIREWQTEHIQAGIKAADEGDFASDSEIAAAFDRWRA